MIKQILLFKFKEEVKKKAVDKFFSKYKQLEKLDCFHSVSCGNNTSDEGFDKGFQYGAVALSKTQKMSVSF